MVMERHVQIGFAGELKTRDASGEDRRLKMPISSAGKRSLGKKMARPQYQTHKTRRKREKK